ncbi:MAG: FKBP-type peptidyl-prolyl cis-trans isomerase [Bacteroidia bacterium]|nr:FKBP-type peptidyl-prolyl cis-trans isomerase [Bacteroidia bacterium]
MNFLNNTIIYLITLLTVLIGCKNEAQTNVALLNDSKLKDTLEDANKTFINTEKQRITSYVTHHNLTMQATGTGLLYSITNATKGAMPVSNSKVTVHYTSSLLNGTLCYTTRQTGAETFRVDHDDVESGLHQGIKLMHKGEKAKFILPAHLAHGLLGDLDKIPPRSAVVYDVELISVK